MEKYGNTDIIPPKENFKAGGINTVRGYKEDSIVPTTTDAINNVVGKGSVFGSGVDVGSNGCKEEGGDSFG